MAAQPAIAAADAVKLFSKQAITVRVPKLGRDGKPETDQDGKRTYAVEERELTAADVFDCKERGGEIVLVTVDGQKYTAAKPGK